MVHNRWAFEASGIRPIVLVVCCHAGYDKNPFYDNAEWEKIKRQGDQAVQNWIENQLKGASVTVVLIGNETASRKWVKYEIRRTIELGKGLIGIDISKISNQRGETDETGVNPLPAGYKRYLWNSDEGRENLGKWIEQAARDAGL
jgi:hypothetical protein